MGTPFERWKADTRKRCKFIVPERVYLEQHRCPFVAKENGFCKRHSIIFKRTGSKIGELPKSASYWEEKYRAVLTELILCKKENENLCRRGGFY